MLDVVIVGAGPAGATAALYASRAGLKVLFVDGSAPGGKLNWTAEVANYPGFEPVLGPDLSDKMFKTATGFGAEYEYDTINTLEREKGGIFKLYGDVGEYETKNVILATGTVERRMGIPGEEELIGRGISYCAVCDAPFFRGLKVAVIGGGNSAVEEAVYIARFALEVHIFVRSKLKASKTALEAMEQAENVHVHLGYQAQRIIEGNGRVAGIEVKNRETDEIESFDIGGVFPFIGADPASTLFDGLGVRDSYGYVITDEFMQTAVPGLYAAGDVRRKILRQLVTATNDGAIASQHIADMNW